MLRILFVKNDIEILQDLSHNHIHPFVRLRALAVLLKSKEVPHKDIAEICGVCKNTVRSYLYFYVDNGVSHMEETNFYSPQCKLNNYEDQIRDYFETSPPSTIKQACIELKAILDFKVGETQLREYIKSIGVKYRKTGSIPGKLDNEKQQEFHDNQLQPKLEEAKKELRKVYFVDAAHFVLGAFLAYLWSFSRIFVRTPSGRQRFNVLGALDAITKKIITVTNDSYITSIQVCDLLRKIKAQTTLPITIILDNAKYQKCFLVQNLATELGIELLYLPSYSPNLNLIERVWKFVKKRVLNGKYYDNFTSFSSSIQDFVDNAHTNYKDELESLLTFNFQLFSDEQIKTKTDKQKNSRNLIMSSRLPKHFPDEKTQAS